MCIILRFNIYRVILSTEGQFRSYSQSLQGGCSIDIVTVVHLLLLITHVDASNLNLKHQTDGYDGVPLEGYAD